MLPKIDTPIFSFTQPSTGKDIRFRPFVVKEEKILMLANDGGEPADMVQAAQQVVQNCCVDDIDVREFTLFDLQYLFIKIKSKSTGEIQSYNLGCGKCKEKVGYDLNLDDLKVTGLDDDVESFVKVSETVGIQLKWPTADLILAGDDDSTIVAMCIDHVVDGEEVVDIKQETVKDVIEFIESLPLNVYEKITEYFRKMPRIEHTLEFTCPKCSEENYVVISGYEHFFG